MASRCCPNGNLDWEGKPIDRNPGRAIAGRPEQAGYMERVADFLERAGMRIESWSERVPQLVADRQFDQEAKKAERAHERRFDDVNRGTAGRKQMNDYLRDGCVEPPKKREFYDARLASQSLAAETSSSSRP